MIEIAPPTTLAEKQKAATTAVVAIEKAWGEGTVIRMGDKAYRPAPHIPTGIFSLDHDVLGIGGFPRGRISEIFGPESSGKTTIALCTIAQAQKAGGLAAFIDVEHALDRNWAAKNEVDVDNLFVCQPDHGEQALDVTCSLIESGGFDIIVVDSVAALVPKAELEGDFGDSHMGLQARMMSQACRKLTGPVARSGCALIFINQIRDKIGVMFGSPETTTGGRALKFYASVRLDVRRKAKVSLGDDNVGNVTKFKGAKNKMATPFRECEVELLFNQGFDADGSTFDAAVEAGIIKQSGSWFSMDGEKLGQGRAQAIKVLKDAGKIEQVLKKLWAPNA
jgi:recombination protein RecA